MDESMRIQLSPGDKLVVTLKGIDGEIRFSCDCTGDTLLRVVGGSFSYVSPIDPEDDLSWGSFYIEPRKRWRGPIKPAIPTFKGTEKCD
jgi:hypothetical protein